MHIHFATMLHANKQILSANVNNFNNTKENDDHHGGKIFLFEIFKGSDF